MSEVTWTDPLVFGTGLTNPSSDLRDVRKVEGEGWGCTVGSMFAFCIFFFFKSSFTTLQSPQALVLRVSSSMKELKRVSSQLWLAMHCCTTSSWPGSSAACSMVWVWGRINTCSTSRIMGEMMYHKCCVCLPPSCTVRRCGIYSDAASGRDCRSGMNLLTVWCPKIEIRIKEQCFKQTKKPHKKPTTLHHFKNEFNSMKVKQPYRLTAGWVFYTTCHIPHTLSLSNAFFFTMIINSVSMTTSIAHLVRAYKFPMVTKEPIKGEGIFDSSN